MRFLVDECTGPKVAQWLVENGHDVYSVADQSPGWTDKEVLNKAITENRILLTNDKDFGFLIFRERLLHMGVIFTWVLY